jgi:hypothetical protein
MAKEPSDAFYLDEEPLRKAIRKGYFGDRVAPLEPEPLMAHLRDLLSGAAGSEGDPGTYRFEDDPDATIPAFFAGIEAEEPGLAALIAEPLLAAAEEMAAGKRKEIAGNVAVFISGLAGSIAVRAPEVKEATAGALLSGILIAIGRLGPRRVRKLYISSTKSGA